MKRVSLPVSKFGHRLFLISQHSAVIKGQYEKNEQMQTGGSGGNASIHFADWIIQFMPWQFNKEYILEEGTGTKVEKDSQKSNIVGHWCKFEIKKSDNQTSGRTVRYPIRYNKDGSGNIWVEYEILEFMLSTGMIKKGGAWLTISDVGKEIQSQFDSVSKMEEPPEKWQGQKKIMAYLSENKEYMRDWYNFFP